MKKLPFPIIVPPGRKIIISQVYGEVANAAFYKAKNIPIPFHQGVDFHLDGERSVSYGAQLITPSPDWFIYEIRFDSPMATSGNKVLIESPEFVEDGVTKKLRVMFFHNSENFNLQGPLPAYTVVALMGNSGAVFPEPSPFCVHCGTHCHLMMYEYHLVNDVWTLQNADNGVKGAIDPLTRFDVNWVIEGKDTGVEKDLPPFFYFISQLASKFNPFK